MSVFSDFRSFLGLTIRCSSCSDKYGVTDEIVFLNRSCSEEATVTIVRRGNMSPPEIRLLPVLILGYARPENVEMLLNSSELIGRKIYLFIDRASDRFASENLRVVQVGREFKGDVEIFQSPVSLGVENALPTALDWIFGTEEKCIILEDDCMPIRGSLQTLDLNINRVEKKIALISLDSPWVNDSKIPKPVFVPSQYPLIWGWATTKDSWNSVSKFKTSTFQLLVRYARAKSLLFRPEYGFFFAAVLRSKFGILKSWDCYLALNLIEQQKMALIPTSSLIDYVGYDLVASNTLVEHARLPKQTFRTELYSISGKDYVSRSIEKHYYGIKKRHVISPLKASLQIVKSEILAKGIISTSGFNK